MRERWDRGRMGTTDVSDHYQPEEAKPIGMVGHIRYYPDTPAITPLFAVVALTGILIACTRDLPEADQTVAPAATSVPTTALKPTVALQPLDTPELVRSDKSRDDSPDATSEERAELVDGNSAFAFDLYHALRENSDGNLFYSPYSISLALAMTYAGARGETERQMADTLHYLLPQERLHTSFNSLDLELASMADAPEEEGRRIHTEHRQRCLGPTRL